MKIFCAYAFTGEDLEAVKQRMRRVVDTLNSCGHTAYCNLDDELVDAIKQSGDFPKIFERAFEVIDESEVVVAIVTSPNKSVGQIMEIGVALSKNKPLYLFEHESAKDSTYLPKLAAKSFYWNTLDELETALKSL